MIRKTLTSAIAAVTLALGVASAGGGTAAAAGPQVSGYVQYHPYHSGKRHWRHDRGYRHGKRWDRHRRWRHARFCSPRKAVHKARRMGLRHAGVVRVNHRAVVVAGRHWGHRARVVFARKSRHCAVIGRRGV